jgi:uncharacterized protein YndB with AHSA1/START domain
MIGALEQVSGKWRLRFTRELTHPPERVWRALTEPEHQEAWFPFRVKGDWVVGGTLTFSSPQGHVPDFDGEVLRMDPPRLLELRWGPDLLRFEVEPRQGGSILTLLDTLEELGKAARDGAGWHECLDWLEAHLDGVEPSFGPGQRWGELHPSYVEAFGPAASTVGPPEGWDGEPESNSVG